MQIEFGNDYGTNSVLSSHDTPSIRKTYINCNWGNVGISYAIPDMGSPKALFVHKVFFSGNRPADQEHFISWLGISNSDAYPKVIHIQKIVSNFCAWVVHPFVLLPHVSISIKFPTVVEDLKKVGTRPTDLGDSFSGNLLMIATPVFLAGETVGSSTIGSNEPTRRIFYSRLFDYKGDLARLTSMKLTQNAVFYKNETLDLSAVPALCYHSADVYYGSSARSNLFTNESFINVDKSPFEAVPAGISDNKTIALPNRCTKRDLRNTIILEFLLPASSTINTDIIANAYTREGDTSMYSRNTFVTQNAGALGAPRGTLLIPCSYRPNYHTKIARIITKITM